MYDMRVAGLPQGYISQPQNMFGGTSNVHVNSGNDNCILSYNNVIYYVYVLSLFKK